MQRHHTATNKARCFNKSNEDDSFSTTSGGVLGSGYTRAPNGRTFAVHDVWSCEPFSSAILVQGQRQIIIFITKAGISLLVHNLFRTNFFLPSVLEIVHSLCISTFTIGRYTPKIARQRSKWRAMHLFVRQTGSRQFQKSSERVQTLWCRMS